MANRFSKERLRQLRNDIPIKNLIANILEIPHKATESQFRFRCPICFEFDTAVNPKTNLARCFRCERNYNPIDIVMIANETEFKEAVKFLARVLYR